MKQVAVALRSVVFALALAVVAACAFTGVGFYTADASLFGPSKSAPRPVFSLGASATVVKVPCRIFQFAQRSDSTYYEVSCPHSVILAGVADSSKEHP